jgi:hypothetical protein
MANRTNGNQFRDDEITILAQLGDEKLVKSIEVAHCKQRGIGCHSVPHRTCREIDKGESTAFLWIPASAGMTTNAASRGELTYKDSRESWRKLRVAHEDNKQLSIAAVTHTLAGQGGRRKLKTPSQV